MNETRKRLLAFSVIRYLTKGSKQALQALLQLAYREPWGAGEVAMECWRCPLPLAPAHPWPLLQRRSSGLRDLRTVIAMTSTWRRAGDISSFVLCCHKPRLTCREASDKRNPEISTLRSPFIRISCSLVLCKLQAAERGTAVP